MLLFVDGVPTEVSHSQQRAMACWPLSSPGRWSFFGYCGTRANSKTKKSQNLCCVNTRKHLTMYIFIKMSCIYVTPAMPVAIASMLGMPILCRLVLELVHNGILVFVS
jgi:hypothetical protein